jgi:hypothetical protein
MRKGDIVSDTMGRERIAILEEHLPYELDALDEALIAWRDIPKRDNETKQQWFRRMSAIEAFWVHARNLEEFFEDRQGDSRTAAASHFSTTRFICSTSEVTKLVEKVQDQVVHLNYDRATSSGQKLNYYEALRTKGHIDRAIQQFQEQLTDEARRHWKPRQPQTLSFPDTPPTTSNHFSVVGSATEIASLGPTGPYLSPSETGSK